MLLISIDNFLSVLPQIKHTKQNRAQQRKKQISQNFLEES
jgi:hypothetical protein